MMNLGVETMKILRKNGKTLDDIEFISLCNFEVPKEKFLKEMFSVEYDNGYGTEEIPPYIISGKGFWLERQTYDGSERWEFRKTIEKPLEKIKHTGLEFSYGDVWKIENAENAAEVDALIEKERLEIRREAVQRYKDKTLAKRNEVSGVVVADEIAEKVISGEEKRVITPEIGREYILKRQKGCSR